MQRPLAALLAAAAALLGAFAGAARAAGVQSAPLSASLAEGPWALAFRQAGAPELRGAPGGLRFRGAAGWASATRVLSVVAERGDLVADVATDDPAGRRLSVRLRPAGDGSITVSASVAGQPQDVSAMAIAFSSPASERFYGTGERSTAVQMRGQDVENYVADGPYTANNRPFVAATLPPWGFRSRDDATYYPVPWVLSSHGYGALLDNDETSTLHLASSPADQWSAEVQAPRLSLRVFAGPTPAAALARFTAATGRQPPPSAPWQFGPWFQTGQPSKVPLADEATWIGLLRKADAPVSVGETQTRYLPCGLDRGNEDYEAQRVKLFHDSGLAILTYVNPMVCASYQPLYSEAAQAGALQRDLSGQPATFNSFVGGIGPLGFAVLPVSQFDFSSPAGAVVYARVLHRMVDSGHDGWMEDFGEYTPPDTDPRDGSPTAGMHNRYPTTYHCAVTGLLDGGLAPRPIVRFQRSGWTGAAGCASDVWGGDPTTTFGYDGLSSAVKQALSIGMSGVSRWGSDIGGYDSLGDDPRLTPELLERWIEFGAVSGVMRTKKSGLAIPSYERPQIWEPQIVGVWRRYAKLHTQLYPYLLAADAAYRASGLPLMRALVLEAPGDARAGAVEDEFGFGPDLLAAPVVTQGATRRSVYLPSGRWIDWLRSVRYEPRDGSFHVAGARVLAGGASHDAPAAVDELPLYLRAGSVVPLLAPDVYTLSDYGRGVVHLRDRADELRLLAFPAPGRRSARAFEADRLDSRGARGRWTLAIRASRTRRYGLEASTALLRASRGARRFVPCSVRLGRRELPRSAWRFDRRAKVMRVRFAARSAVLTVADRC